MAKMWVSWGIVAALLTPACGEGTPEASFDPSQNGLAGKADQAAAAVSVLDTSTETRQCGCAGLCVYGHDFTVDLQVRNDAYDKQVGIVWTKNDWTSHAVASASYVEPLDDGHERWRVEVIEQGCSTTSSEPPEFEFAAFVKMNGAEHWDPANNHHVTPRHVELDTAHIVQNPCSGGIGVCAADLVLEAVVDPGAGEFEAAFVRWTRDGWASFDDAELDVVSAPHVRPIEVRERIDLRTADEQANHDFDLSHPVEFKVYAVISGDEVWESGPNHVRE